MCSAVMAPWPGPFFIFCSPCLLSFSIQLSHSLAPTSVCTLSAGRGWRRELPLHTFITWAIFMWAARLRSAGDERGLERCSRCVGSAWGCSVFFIWLGHGPGLFFSIFHAFFPSLYLCTVGNVWDSLRFYSISRLLSLVWPLSALFLLLPAAAVVPHLIFQVVIMWKFLLSFSPDLPLNLSTSIFFFFLISVLPILHCIIFGLHFLVAVFPWLARAVFFFSLFLSASLHSFLLCVFMSCNDFLSAGLSRKGLRERQVGGSKACYSFLPSVWHVWRMEGDLEPRAHCNFTLCIRVGHQRWGSEPVRRYASNLHTSSNYPGSRQAPAGAAILLVQSL